LPLGIPVPGWQHEAKMRTIESPLSLTRAVSINRQGSAAPLAGGWEQGPLSCHRRRSAGIFLASLAMLSVLFVQNNARAQDRTDLEKQLQETEASLAKVDNYTAVFHRIERVNGKLIAEEITLLKFKQPFKVYMRWINPLKGQESLYVEGANNNKVKAHGTGLTKLITVNLNPTSAMAMENSRHPITDAGLENLVKLISSNLQRGLRAGELISKDHGEQTVYGRKTRKIEGVLPKDPAKGYYCYRCIVNLDVETRMPIKTQIFDWDDQLVECYGYENLNLNPGLGDKDFDPKNPEYHF
jgi:outer membrane lipoprotein-sorting protein